MGGSDVLAFVQKQNAHYTPGCHQKHGGYFGGSHYLNCIAPLSTTDTMRSLAELNVDRGSSETATSLFLTHPTPGEFRRPRGLSIRGMSTGYAVS